jgi:poly(rC)-binding protein 2/3/4
MGIRFFSFFMFYDIQISGAMIEISDAKSARGDRIAYISGKPEQKQAAENLIQAFIMAT